MQLFTSMCTDYEGPDKKKKAEIEKKVRQELFGFVPHARVRPTDPAAILMAGERLIECREMNWGWRVPWSKSPLVNAKSETVTTLATFKGHINERCLIVAQCFKEGGAVFSRPKDEVLFMAGLWREDGGQRFVMLTTTPNESVAPFHHRMPFLLGDEQLIEWLRGDYLKVLANPDKSPLQKFQKQPDLF